MSFETSWWPGSAHMLDPQETTPESTYSEPLFITTGPPESPGFCFEGLTCVTFTVVLERVEGAEGGLLIKKEFSSKGCHSIRAILVQSELCFT